MNYIYDIVLNFQTNYYNFYEWNKEDKIKNISKLPLYKITDKDMNDLKNNKIIVNENFINQIKNDNKKNKKIICVVATNNQAIGLLFNQTGTLIKRSSLIFEEEEEAIDIARCLKITPIEYLENIKKNPQNKLRIVKENKEMIIDYIKKSNNILNLKYLYYEYYEKEENNIDKIKTDLLNELSKEWSPKQNTIYNLINILTKVKNK